MVRFRPGTPVVTDTPRVTVDAGLQPGRYRFQLTVENRRGQRSIPQDFIVVVRESSGRVPSPEPILEAGRRPRPGRTRSSRRTKEDPS